MGSFPAPVTGWEFVLDKDGTVCKIGSTVASQAEIKAWNDYSVGEVGLARYTYVSYLFPEIRSITAYSISNRAPGNTFIQTSADTTDGINGTWNTVVDNANMQQWQSADLTKLRSPLLVAWNSIQAVRIYHDWDQGPRLNDVHFWGTYTFAALQLTHPTIDQPLTAADMDFGDVQRNQMIQKSFRVKNLSAQTANNITVALDNVGTSNMYTNTNLVYGSSAKSHNIGNLAPGAISAIIIAQRDVGASEPQGVVETVRLGASAGSWT
jgi:hypothetical protein